VQVPVSLQAAARAGERERRAFPLPAWRAKGFPLQPVFPATARSPRPRQERFPLPPERGGGKAAGEWVLRPRPAHPRETAGATRICAPERRWLETSSHRQHGDCGVRRKARPTTRRQGKDGGETRGCVQVDSRPVGGVGWRERRRACSVSLRSLPGSTGLFPRKTRTETEDKPDAVRRTDAAPELNPKAPRVGAKECVFAVCLAPSGRRSRRSAPLTGSKKSHRQAASVHDCGVGPKVGAAKTLSHQNA
jgi:hypothetical protein